MASSSPSRSCSSITLESARCAPRPRRRRARRRGSRSGRRGNRVSVLFVGVDDELCLDGVVLRPLIAAACCTYCTSAWNSLARSSLSPSMSCARVSLRGVPRTMSAAVRGLAAAWCGLLRSLLGHGLSSRRFVRGRGRRAQPLRRGYCTKRRRWHYLRSAEGGTGRWRRSAAAHDGEPEQPGGGKHAVHLAYARTTSKGWD